MPKASVYVWSNIVKVFHLFCDNSFFLQVKSVWERHLWGNVAPVTITRLEHYLPVTGPNGVSAKLVSSKILPEALQVAPIVPVERGIEHIFQGVRDEGKQRDLEGKGGI